MSLPVFKAALAHVAPVFLQTQPTIAKACSLIAEAAKNGAQLIVFPETYVSAFPVWSALRSPIYNHDLFRQLAASSLLAGGPELEQVCQTARRSGMVVSLGFNERSPASLGCIYNSNVLIGPEGDVLNHHRKLAPTFYEKLSWAPGDGAGLRVCDTPCGRVGMLICGENTNPLARYTMIAQGEQVHLASYPPIWPSHDPAQAGNYDLAQAIRIRTAAHSFEAKAFNLVASGFMDEPMHQLLCKLHPDAAKILEASPRSVSLATGPSGQTLGEPLQDNEGLLYVDVDVSQCVEPKQFHDISGGYNRFDVFQLTVDRSANRPIAFVNRDLDSRPQEGELFSQEETEE
ncbi:carbon-nitrogen hydrolase family protein [Lignipirellula cremea]|uniref:Nitrilase n=1 Tax=Lignipirellula cremea TaxID=2528010 RepID=A0A518E073_9BACT|nr:carbon-nitrogen hydrolase family protein [Lignipirellula cremea]QDU97496.1 Nitrilase [Lignipirellula cremea]